MEGYMSVWKLLTMLYDASNSDNPRMDAATSSIQTVGFAEHKKNEGMCFYGYLTNDVAAAGSKGMLITTPDTTTWAHLSFVIESEREGSIALYEDVTTSNDGSALTEFNMNRNSATAATTVLHSDPTITDYGTPLLSIVKIAGTPLVFPTQNSVWGRNQPLVLDQNKKYLLLYTNLDVSNVSRTNILVEWYEHANIN
jgi:hypothetical protein